MKKIATVGVVNVYWNSDWKEFICKVKGKIDGEYFTTEKDDALATAEAMNAEMAKRGAAPGYLPNWSDV